MLAQLPPPPPGKTGWPWTEETEPVIYEKLKRLPRISIVTPSYNQGEYIEQTIRSVLLQNYPNLEYIIIDGGSSDNTKSVIAKYEKWLNYYISEKDKGQSEAINKGIEKCTGDIFNWLNSDDYYYTDCFKLLAENYDPQETYMIAGNYRFFSEGKNEKKERIIKFRLRDTTEETIAGVLINQPSCFFKLSVFRELGKLNENMQFVMDQDIWKKFLFMHGISKVRIVDDEFTNFRFHQTSKSYKFEFNTEYVNIFYSIAEKVGLVKQTEFFRKTYGTDIGKNYEFGIIIDDENLRLAKRVISNFIFFLARTAYTTRDFKLLRNSLDALDKRFLNEKQREYALKLKIKSKLVKYKLSPVLKLLSNDKIAADDLRK